MTEPLGSTIGGYRIDAVVGIGGMASVYRAQHPRLPRLDAVKVLAPSYAADPVYRARFEREAARAATLDHPGIVKVYDRGEERGRLWMSMQLITGTDTVGLLRERPQGLPLRQVVDIVTAIGDALDYANSAGVLHRDVKPANIFVDRTGPTPRYLLGDFGIARGHTDTRLTQVGSVVGTVDYCSPEQLSGEHIDGRSDQYSLAATAVHLLIGERPYGTASAATISRRHLSAPIPRPSETVPGLPRAVDDVIARAMAKAPEDRYPNSYAFAGALTAASRGDTPNPPTRAARGAPTRAVSPEVTDEIDGAASPTTGRMLTKSAVIAAVVVASLAGIAWVGIEKLGSKDTAGDTVRTAILDDDGVMDPCLIPSEVLGTAGLGPMTRGTAPAPIRDCYSPVTSTPGATVEFAVYPATSAEIDAVESRARFQAGRQVTDLPGWRSYTTSSGPGGTSPTYCNVSYNGPKNTGFLELYTLLTPSPHDRTTPALDIDQRRALCDRLPAIAKSIASTVPEA